VYTGEAHFWTMENNMRELEKFLEDWSYFDSEEKKLGWLKMFRNSELFRKTQWTVHYKLN
jgi:hypothetical protein